MECHRFTVVTGSLHRYHRLTHCRHRGFTPWLLRVHTMGLFRGWTKTLHGKLLAREVAFTPQGTGKGAGAWGVSGTGCGCRSRAGCCEGLEALGELRCRPQEGCWQADVRHDFPSSFSRVFTASPTLGSSMKYSPGLGLGCAAPDIN